MRRNAFSRLIRDFMAVIGLIGRQPVKRPKSPRLASRFDDMVQRLPMRTGQHHRAVVTTTDKNAKVSRFAQQQKVALLTAAYLRHWVGDEDILKDRLSLEELTSNIQAYSGHKQDGDWLKQITVAKSAMASLAPYPAFNRAIASFRFFAERAATRPQYREQALRGAVLSAALACVALDAALERLAFEEPKARYRLLYEGVTYGDAGDNRVQKSIDTVLSVIARGVNNGKVIARQAGDALEEMFSSVRAEIIAEFFAKEQHSSHIFPVARELEFRAHARDRADLTGLSIEAKSVIGVFADFIGAKRIALLSSEFETKTTPTVSGVKSNRAASSLNDAQVTTSTIAAGNDEASKGHDAKDAEGNPTLL